MDESVDRFPELHYSATLGNRRDYRRERVTVTYVGRYA